MSYSKKIDEKWQKNWKENNLYVYDPKSKKPKFYTMEMFSYPSGAKLHLGHWFNFAPADSFARFKKMQGYNVFHPMGFDAFGLPAENYAIKTGIHPEDSTLKNIATMKRQLDEMGGSYDWNYSVETCMPNYYKWTQWLFLQLYKKGLAYKKAAPVNWCDSCKTVLANEQVIDYKCERCGSVVEKKKLEQWFFKITDYADELLEDLDKLDWPDSTKKVQFNWIGKSQGSEVLFKTEDGKHEFKVFTTRVDTLCGVTYVVVAPEGDLAKQITTPECKAAVDAYREQTAKLSEIDRMSTEREKTGTFTGSYAINPLTGDKVPIWVADYVIEDYGTGAVMAVPAHDERDFAFATKYNLPIKQVVIPKDATGEQDLVEAYVEKEEAKLINSGKYDDMPCAEAREKITADLEKEGKGNKTTNYRLKDWLVSRQRYWGAPIPVIYCDDCGTVPVPEKDLPVLLPYDVEFKPDGESPLKKSESFMNCTCPKCGKPAKREADTLDTFVCSSWYELRYPDAQNDDEAFNKETIDKMAPIDVYVGGKEHAAMHLIYVRFITKALRDMGFLSFDEPFKRLIHQGMILGPDGNKMSKSKGNTVSPDEYIEKVGADIFRMYLMFGFDYKQGGPWNDKGIEAMQKFFARIEKLVETYNEIFDAHENPSTPALKKIAEKFADAVATAEKDLMRVKANTIKSMENDIGEFQFNTAIAREMELLNAINKYLTEEKINFSIIKDTIETFFKLIAPLAPHFAEEEWQHLKRDNNKDGKGSFDKDASIHMEEWPKLDEDELKGGTQQIPIQVNGKLRATIDVDAALSPDEKLKVIKANEKVATFLDKYADKVKKEIYVPGRLLNIVMDASEPIDFTILK